MTKPLEDYFDCYSRCPSCQPVHRQPNPLHRFAGATQVGIIGGSDRADQEYVWISQFSSLPLFVERVYPALDAFAADFGVKVRRAGPNCRSGCLYRHR